MNWINKDTEIYCSFAKEAGNTGCQMMNTAFYYYGLNKIYKSFSVDSIEDAVHSVKTLGIKGFAITMPYKIDVLNYEYCILVLLAHSIFVHGARDAGLYGSGGKKL